jgi:hypothetical protein
MKFTRSKFQRFAQFLTLVFLCGILLISNALPTLAGGITNRSKTTDSEAKLNRIIDDSENAAKSDPPSLGEVQRKAQEGPNEVQGSADLDKMKHPDNSRGATSVEDQVRKTLDKVVGDR